MNTMVCQGLDGGNPLHMLAALGVFRLLVLRDQEAKMRWVWEGGWRPEFIWDHGEEGESMPIAARWLRSWLNELGTVGTVDTTLTRQVNTLKAEYKKSQEHRKELVKEAKKEIKRLQLKGTEAKELERQATRAIDEIITAQMKFLQEVQQCQNDALGQGMAHLGDIIGVPAPIFRRKATMAVHSYLDKRKGEVIPRRDHPDLVVDALAAQGSDAILDGGRVQFTPFSFSNGSSGQCLLKDFRKCAAASSEHAVRGTLAGQPVLMEKVTGLNWNPTDQRAYALQWQDPATGAADDPAVNALAFIGFSLLAAFPTGTHLAAVCWMENKEGAQAFVWPMWSEAIGSDEVRSLLSMAPSLLAEKRELLTARGVTALFMAKRINPTGKRNFFAPAQAL